MTSLITCNSKVCLVNILIQIYKKNVVEAFQTTISQLGGVDIVINNASVMNDRLWELEVDVNLVNSIKINTKTLK